MGKARGGRIRRCWRRTKAGSGARGSRREEGSRWRCSTAGGGRRRTVRRAGRRWGREAESCGWLGCFFFSPVYRFGVTYDEDRGLISKKRRDFFAKMTTTYGQNPSLVY